MLCMSCSVDVDPKWTHAIESNSCPFCGKLIVDERLKDSFVEMKILMTDLIANFKEELDDWLLSNYNYIKTDSEDLINYLPEEALKSVKKYKDEESFLKRKAEQKFKVKIKNEDDSEEEIDAEKTQSEETTNEFISRADAHTSISKANKLRDLVKKIKSDGVGSTPMMTESSMNGIDEEKVLEMQNFLDPGNIIHSGLQSMEDDDGTDPEMKALADQMEGIKTNKSNAVSEKDLKALREMHAKANRAKGAINSGKGGFVRG